MSPGQAQAQLVAVFAEGVELARLPEEKKLIEFSKTRDRLVVGRNKQATTLWEALVPDGRLRNTVSREHFEITAVQEDGVQVFVLKALSANGLMVNQEFLDSRNAPKRLQHGDILAFAANLDGQDRPPVGPAGTMPRKPFLHLQFRSVAAAAAPIAAPPAPMQPQKMQPPAPSEGPRPPSCQWDDEDEADSEASIRPPEGTVTGIWRKSACNPRSEALFCLMVHGDSVRNDLPSEARKLVFECNPNDPMTPPALRVGRFYQRGFWKRVFKPEWRGGSTLDAEIFEIRTSRKNNPATRETPDWRFRVRALTSRGLVLKYGPVSESLNTNGEHELQPSDTLTVDLPSPDHANRPLMGALHFTFIPYCTTSQQQASSSTTAEAPRLIPDFAEAVDDSVGGMVLERSYSAPQRHPSNPSTMSRLSAGALRAPVTIPIDTESPPGLAAIPKSSPSYSSQRQSGPNPGHYGDSMMGTIALEPMETTGDPDDLFAKTGFGAGAAVEGRIPALAGNGYARGQAPGAPNPQQPRRDQEGQGNWFGSLFTSQ